MSHTIQRPHNQMGGEEDPSEAQGSSDGRTLTPSVWRNVDTVAFAFVLLQTHYVGNGIKLKSVALCRRVGRRPNLVEAKRSFCRTMRLFAFHVTTAIHGPPRYRDGTRSRESRCDYSGSLRGCWHIWNSCQHFPIQFRTKYYNFPVIPTLWPMSVEAKDDLAR